MSDFQAYIASVTVICCFAMLIIYMCFREAIRRLREREQ